MKQFITKTALSAMALLFLLGGSTAAFANTSQPISLTGQGYVTSLGNQTYTVAGGQVAYAYVDGQLVNNARITYGFYAVQTGETTSGYGTIRLTGTIQGFGNVVVSGTFNLDDNTPTTQILPLYLPNFFVSDAPNVGITLGGSTTALGQPLLIENPYFNPFGNPILITSYDEATIIIAATYSVGTIQWTGTQVTSQVTGTIGTTPVSGFQTLTGNEFENLVAATASDQGQTSWSDMTPSSLNGVGTYQGTDVIPQQGATDCSPAELPGICTETGFYSQGTFTIGDIHGTYTTQWGIPALTFISTILANQATSGGQGSGNGGSGQGSGHGIFGFLGLLGSYFHF